MAMMMPKANGKLSIAKFEVAGIKALQELQRAKVNQYRQGKKTPASSHRLLARICRVVFDGINSKVTARHVTSYARY